MIEVRDETVGAMSHVIGVMVEVLAQMFGMIVHVIANVPGLPSHTAVIAQIVVRIKLFTSCASLLNPVYTLIMVPTTLAGYMALSTIDISNFLKALIPKSRSLEKIDCNVSCCLRLLQKRQGLAAG